MARATIRKARTLRFGSRRQANLISALLLGFVERLIRSRQRGSRLGEAEDVCYPARESNLADREMALTVNEFSSGEVLAH